MSVSNLTSLLDVSTGLPSPNSMSSEQDYSGTFSQHNDDGAGHRFGGRDGRGNANCLTNAHFVHSAEQGTNGSMDSSFSAAPPHPNYKSSLTGDQYITDNHKDDENANGQSKHSGTFQQHPAGVGAFQQQSQHAGQAFSMYDRSGNAHLMAAHQLPNGMDGTNPFGHDTAQAGFKMDNHHDINQHMSSYAGSSQASRPGSLHYPYPHTTHQIQLHALPTPQGNELSRTDSANSSQGVTGENGDVKSEGGEISPGGHGGRSYSQGDNGVAGGPNAGKSAGVNSTSAPNTPLVAPRNAYKRFRNAFIFFVNEQRKLRNPGQMSIKNREFVQMMSAEWKKLSDEEKKPYNEMARRDRERFDRDVETYGRIPPRPARSSVQSKTNGLANYSNQGISPLNVTDWRSLPPEMAAGQHYPFMAARDPAMYHLPMEHFQKLNGGRPGDHQQIPSYDYLLYNYPHTPNKVMTVTTSLPNSLPSTPGLPTPGGHTPNHLADLTPPPGMDHRVPSGLNPPGYMGGPAQGFPTPSMSTPTSNMPSPQHANNSHQPASNARHPSGMHSLMPTSGVSQTMAAAPHHMQHPSLVPTSQGFYQAQQSHGQQGGSQSAGSVHHHTPNSAATAAGAQYSFHQSAAAAISPLVPMGHYGNQQAAALAAAQEMHTMSLNNQGSSGNSSGMGVPVDMNGLSLNSNVSSGNSIQMINGVPTMVGNGQPGTPQQQGAFHAPTATTQGGVPGNLSAHAAYQNNAHHHHHPSGQIVGGTTDSQNNQHGGMGVHESQPSTPSSTSYLLEGATSQPSTMGSALAESKLGRAKSVKTKRSVKQRNRNPFIVFVQEQNRAFMAASATNGHSSNGNGMTGNDSQQIISADQIHNILDSSKIDDVSDSEGNSGLARNGGPHGDVGNGLALMNQSYGEQSLNPGMSSEEFVKYMGQKWKTMSAEEKQHYRCMAEREQQ
ncbi:hypothetical protein IWQ62_003470 [Dispira parvispora]|uniref:HMG box domain-containing protein n=1 Tax=Dispira parvispora TaxID=1520584 RepID=A0A9W8AUS0_9FUNG|nr:hypothetical protein IWQ62_003470 [Dispira parvispora]